MIESHGYRPTSYPHRIEHDWTRRLTADDLVRIIAIAQTAAPDAARTVDARRALALDLLAQYADQRQAARLMTHGRVRTDGEHVLIDSTDDGAEGADDGGDWWTLIDTTTGDTIDLSTAEAGRMGVWIDDDEEAFSGVGDDLDDEQDDDEDGDL